MDELGRVFYSGVLLGLFVAAFFWIITESTSNNADIRYFKTHTCTKMEVNDHD